MGPEGPQGPPGDPATGLQSVVDDPAPALGGDLDTNNRRIIATGANALELRTDTGDVHINRDSISTTNLGTRSAFRFDGTTKQFLFAADGTSSTAVVTGTDTNPLSVRRFPNTHSNVSRSAANFQTMWNAASATPADGFGASVQLGIREKTADVFLPQAVIGSQRQGANDSGALFISTFNAGVENTPSLRIAPDGTIRLGKALDADNQPIVNVPNPTNPQDAATKNYVDGRVSVIGSAVATGSIISTTAVIPYDNTVPQDTEGVLLVQTTYTVKSATSRLRITAACPIVDPSGSTAIGAVFMSGSANALVATTVANTVIAEERPQSMVVMWEGAAGSAGTKTFQFRGGSINATQVVFFGRTTSLATALGSTGVPTIRVEEIAV